ncbi:MAG: hypothetical protein ACT4QE_01130 [Anaerolineales bacterium]
MLMAPLARLKSSSTVGQKLPAPGVLVAVGVFAGGLVGVAAGAVHWSELHPAGPTCTIWFEGFFLIL